MPLNALSNPISQEEIDIRQRLKDDFEHYASRCLMIRTKEEGLERFKLNSAQKILHGIAEKQLQDTGRVRIIILKGRQMGCSTYIEGRFYWKVTHRRGARAYILTHESDATANLFNMVSRFHENNNPLVKPSTDRDSGKELNFDRLDSGYKVGTAGTKETGRSSTIQYFHGSEVGFWAHAKNHAKGVLESVPERGSEVFLESTSDGMGNYFHQTWVKAVAGLNEYIPVFMPWWIEDGYRATVPGGTVFDEEEMLYQETHGIDGEQLMFRRNKIASLGDAAAFKREYPATAQEAFESTGYRQIIPAEQIAKARGVEVDGYGPLVLGVDPARYGDDRTAD